MRLLEFLQKYSVDRPMGGTPGVPRRTASDAAAYEDLKRVQRTNETYFRIYFGVLIASFLMTVGFALVCRHEMGGLAAVLGAGGAIQSGIVVLISREWREKVRVDIVAVLSRRLDAKELQLVLMELLAQLSDETAPRRRRNGAARA